MRMNFIASAHHTKHFLRGVAFLFARQKSPSAEFTSTKGLIVKNIKLLATTIGFKPFNAEVASSFISII